MFANRFLLLFFLLIPFTAGCAHSKSANKTQKFDNCQLVNARAAWRQNNYEAQYSALLATCGSGDWRLLLKADWGTTAIDLAFLNGKLLVITKPSPLSVQVVEILAQKLSGHLSTNLISEQIAIDLPENNILLELNKLSERVLPESQAKNLFNI